MVSTILLIVIFFVTWIITSIFTVAGLGGAVVLVPILYSLGIPFSVAADTGLFLNIFSLFIAMVNNARRGNVLMETRNHPPNSYSSYGPSGGICG